jgi:hypothetical protein
MLPTFEDCTRRLYMSATIADDSEIVRAFDASTAAIGKPITSTPLAGVGERMILIPELMNVGGTPVEPMVKNIASYLAKHHRRRDPVAVRSGRQEMDRHRGIPKRLTRRRSVRWALRIAGAERKAFRLLRLGHSSKRSSFYRLS